MAGQHQRVNAALAVRLAHEWLLNRQRQRNAQAKENTESKDTTAKEGEGGDDVPDVLDPARLPPRFAKGLAEVRARPSSLDLS